MTLKNWFELRGLDPYGGLCMSLATDGFSPTKHALSGAFMYGCWPDAEYMPLYIKGANVAAVTEYTGITPNYYNERAIEEEAALCDIQAAVSEADFVITYFADRFFHKWVAKHLEGCVDVPVIDVMVLGAAAGRFGHVMAQAPDVGTLQDMLSVATLKQKFGKFEELCRTYSPRGSAGTGVPQGWELWFNEQDKLPLAEQNVWKLKEIWQSLLHIGAL